MPLHTQAPMAAARHLRPGPRLLRVLRCMPRPDPTLPSGAHLVQWVQAKRGNNDEILDERLRGSSGEADPYEMRLGDSASEADAYEMWQVLTVATLCVSDCADDRPAMKDAVAQLEEIRSPAVADDAKPAAAALPTAAAAPLLSPAMGCAHSRDDSFAVSDCSA